MFLDGLFLVESFSLVLSFSRDFLVDASFGVEFVATRVFFLVVFEVEGENQTDYKIHGLRLFQSDLWWKYIVVSLKWYR